MKPLMNEVVMFTNFPNSNIYRKASTKFRALASYTVTGARLVATKKQKDFKKLIVLFADNRLFCLSSKNRSLIKLDSAR